MDGRRWETWRSAPNAPGDQPKVVSVTRLYDCDCIPTVAACNGARSISASLSFGPDQLRTPYFLNQAII